MSVLALHVRSDGVTAVAVDPDGSVVTSGGHGLAHRVPQPGWFEHAPEEIWQATLAATRAALTGYDASLLTAVGISNDRDVLLLWDRETLGSPRAAIGGRDRRAEGSCAVLRATGAEDRVRELTGRALAPTSAAPRLRWLAEHEPRTWALVEEGRYAVGSIESYLVARMTRGTWHVTDVSNAGRTLLLDLGDGRWSAELCRLFGVPRDALPELVPSWGEIDTTDARSFCGLSLPIAGLAGDEEASLFGQACFAAGEARYRSGAEPLIVTNTGTNTGTTTGNTTGTAAWRAPDGELTRAVEALAPAGTLPSVTRLRVDGRPWPDDAGCRDLADRLGLPVERPRVTQTAALGAAFLAGLGTGAWDSTDQLREVWQLDRRFEPAAG